MRNKRKHKGQKKLLEAIISIEEVANMSGSEGDMPPEDEWDADAKTLKAAIVAGAFNHLLKGDGISDNDESIDEIILDESDDEEVTEESLAHINSDNCSSANESGSEAEANTFSDDDSKEGLISRKSQISSKALAGCCRDLHAERGGLGWPELFTVEPKDRLFAGSSEQGGFNVHDDLKREVAFYDLALKGVQIGRSLCAKHDIPFARPNDFYAEMVKSDEHMARIKDRLIFETKKIDTVAQRKFNKEQKLREKEAREHRSAEKGRMGSTEVEFEGQSNKRKYADKKYGYGGKRGRFKQNDPKDINNMSDYNVKGNFSGGMKKGSSASTNKGGKRKGKRARDAIRSRG